MICYFCENIIPYNSIFHSESYGDLRVGECPFCKNDQITTTMVTHGDKLVSAHLYVQWGEERYRLLLHLQDDYFALVHVTSEKDQRAEIYKTNEIPNINFHNVLNKLPLFLTFL